MSATGRDRGEPPPRFSITEFDEQNEMYLLDEWMARAYLPLHRCFAASAPSTPRGKHLTLEKKMAYSLLFSERPQVAGVASINPLRALARWVADMRTRRAQRIALSSLLD